ncbi:MAG TPA: hypothetical protein VGP72_07720 [Planctomycetota bacterium]|jgi:hypothetical protein
MQASAILNIPAFEGLLAYVFETGDPQVYEAYSEYGQKLKRFDTVLALNAHLGEKIKKGRGSDYGIYYPDMKGTIQEARIALDPKKCGGHTFWYSLDGWGVIQLQCDVVTGRRVECRIAVNTRKRAKTWSRTYPEMGRPALWNWSAVESHAGQLIRRLKNLARQSPDKGARAKR